MKRKENIKNKEIEKYKLKFGSITQMREVWLIRGVAKVERTDKIQTIRASSRALEAHLQK